MTHILQIGVNSGSNQGYWQSPMIDVPAHLVSHSHSSAHLVDQTKELRPAKILPITLEFASLTTCNWISPRNKMYGSHYTRLPLPHYIFPGLAKRWRELALPELAHVVQRERIEAYIEANGIVIEDYQLQTHRVHFTTHQQPGFLGTCTYYLRAPMRRRRWMLP